jgi:hypothetical protein
MGGSVRPVLISGVLRDFSGRESGEKLRKLEPNADENIWHGKTKSATFFQPSRQQCYKDQFKFLQSVRRKNSMDPKLFFVHCS